MTRTILTPAAPPAAALAELKQWLGITVAADDASLTRVFAAALEACESFTGLMLLEQTCAQTLPALGCWQALATRPVQAILGVARNDGTDLPSEAYALDLGADGTGQVRLLAPETGRVTVRFTAGMAAQWDVLPEGLRHGVVRLAAHQHRERESSGASPLPPASVAALWRPWRRLRLA